jgi:hypothetical protein
MGHRVRQAYPTRPIRFVVGGWSVPVGISRPACLRKRCTRTRPIGGHREQGGLEGVLSATLVAQSAPDGYTLLPAVSSQMTMNPVLIEAFHDPVHGSSPYR